MLRGRDVRDVEEWLSLFVRAECRTMINTTRQPGEEWGWVESDDGRVCRRNKAVPVSQTRQRCRWIKCSPLSSWVVERGTDAWLQDSGVLGGCVSVRRDVIVGIPDRSAGWNWPLERRKQTQTLSKTQVRCGTNAQTNHRITVDY